MPTVEEKKAKLVSIILPILKGRIEATKGISIQEIAAEIADAILAQHDTCQNHEKGSG